MPQVSRENLQIATKKVNITDRVQVGYVLIISTMSCSLTMPVARAEHFTLPFLFLNTRQTKEQARRQAEGKEDTWQQQRCEDYVSETLTTPDFCCRLPTG